MRVLFLQRQPCIRAYKYAVGLRSARPGLRLGFAFQGLSPGERYGRGDDFFDRLWRLDAAPAEQVRDQLVRALDEFRPDVVHAHNLPDELTVMALEVADGTPVVHDVHDLQSLRSTPYEDGFPEPEDPLALERRAVEGCAALVTVSAELLEEIGARHRLPARTLLFANYALTADLPAELPAPGRGAQAPPRIVYQGSLSTNGGHYDLRDLFARIVGEGLRLDVFPSRPAPAYEELAAALGSRMRCLPTLDPPSLLRALPEYDFGWAGFNATLNGAHLHTALPNKAFEYVGCGVPVLTLDHRALVRLIRESGAGVALDGLDDLPGRLGELDLAELRRCAAAARGRLTVEANVAAVAELYETLIS
jgi:glycosyltransferase involved in cell wall biosynthesis